MAPGSYTSEPSSDTHTSGVDSTEIQILPTGTTALAAQKGVIEGMQIIENEPCRDSGYAYDPKHDGYGRFRQSKYHAPKSQRKVKAKLVKASKKRNRR